MPIIKSAKKALRSSAKKKVSNTRYKRSMKESVRAVRDLAIAKKKKEADKLLPSAYKAIDKASKKGLIKKNTAARKKSRLTRLVSQAR